jgi:hypothetical protein
MNKVVLIITITFVSIFSASTQTNSFGKGAYLSIKDFLNNKPVIEESNYKIKKTFPVIADTVVGVFKIFSNNDSYSNNYLRKNILVASKNDSLYLNSKVLDITVTSQFCKVVTTGRYMVFLVGIKNDEAQKIATIAFGLIGYIFASGGGEIKLYAYCLDTETEYSEILNPNRVNELLSPFPDLLNSYQNEIDNRSNDIMINYVERLNEKFPPPVRK